MKKISLLFFLIVFAIIVKAQGNKDPLPPVYDGCCGTKAIEFTLGNSKVYVPNVFTPNGDGLNDLFMPHSSDDINIIQGYTIRSAKNDTLIYTKDLFYYGQIDDYAWNGKRSRGDGAFTTDYQGLFKYEMRIVNAAGQARFIEGEACVIRCGKESKVFKNRDGCFYADQAEAVDDKGKGRGNGKLDKVKKTQEKDCY